MNHPAPDLLCLLDADRPVRVRAAQDADEPRWESFVEVCPEATFFHRFGWKRVLERTLGHRTRYLLAEQAGRLVGILPLAEVRSLLFGRSLASLPFCVYGGAASMLPAARSALHRAAAELAEARAVGYLELRNLQRREPGWPLQDLYVTFRKEISGDEAADLLAIPRKQRAMVRKGMRAGLRSEVDPGTGHFFPLYADNMRRHGTPALARGFFDALRQEFGSDCEVLTVFDRRGRPVSSVLSFYFRDEVLPYYAGDLEAARELAANDFKYWELMRRAGLRGARVFDYGRSKRGTGSFDFKKNWGFEPAPLHYEYHLVRSATPPRNNPLNPRYRMLAALWRRLPIALTNAIGPHIVRSLG